MDIFEQYIILAMLSWVPLSQHINYEPVEKTVQRYQTIAQSISSVVREKDIVLPFDGTDADVKTGLLLASIGSSESGFQISVYSCAIGGDNDVAWGIYQTHSSKYKTCSDLKVATRIALTIINQSFDACKTYDLLDKLAAYTCGTCHDNWKPSRLKMNTALDWFYKHPYPHAHLYSHYPYRIVEGR